jgi:hypothetical protein
MRIHDARVAVGGVVGAGSRQQQRDFNGFVYSAAASRDVMKKLYTVFE